MGPLSSTQGPLIKSFAILVWLLWWSADIFVPYNFSRNLLPTEIFSRSVTFDPHWIICSFLYLLVLHFSVVYCYYCAFNNVSALRICICVEIYKILRIIATPIQHSFPVIVKRGYVQKFLLLLHSFVYDTSKWNKYVNIVIIIIQIVSCVYLETIVL